MELGSAAAFDRTGTLGVEEEFYIVDQRARPTSGIQDLVYDHPPSGILDDRIDHELFQCTIETQTPMIDDVDAVGDVVREVRDALVDPAADHGYRNATEGSHPAAN